MLNSHLQSDHVILFSQRCKHLSEFGLLPNKIVHNSTQSKGSTINANPKYRTKLERDNKKLTLQVVNYNTGQKDSFTENQIH